MGHKTPARLLISASILSLCFGYSSVAAFADETQDDTDTVETVVVTGVRAAIASAIDIKQSASQIVDAVVADDVGKLPDSSVTEVLQRVSGVSITHFGATGDPDHYSVEGSGVAVRGMTQVASTLNGRESFSANGGRSLLWEDVPPELMAAVKIYKSSQADQIEGGVGGTIDLRTHMPFDFDGFKLQATGGASYGDLIKQTHPKFSVMTTDQWNTSIGRIGVLVDLAYSDMSYRNDSMQIEPYFPHESSDSLTLYKSGEWTATDETIWVPGGFDYRTTTIRRKRLGLYEAVQWQPVNNLTVSQSVFVSYYHSNTGAYAFLDSAGSGMTLGYDTTNWTIANYTTDSNNNLTSVDNLVNSNFMWYTPSGLTCIKEDGTESTSGGDCSLGTIDTEYSESNNRTTDITESFDWDANAQWNLAGAFQYVHSTSGSDSLAVYGTTMLSAISMDLRHVYPEITVPNNESLVNAATTNWAATMDHHSKNSGTLMAVNMDATYRPENWGFIKSLKFGARGAVRKENDRDTGYTYTSLSPWYSDYDTEGNTMWYFSEDTGDTQTVNFHNYFRGKIQMPGAILFPAMSKVKKLNTRYWHKKYSYLADGDDIGNETYDPRDLNFGETKGVSLYGMASYASPDGFFGYPVDGNIGFRVVYNHNYSSGYIKQSSSADLILDGTTFDLPEGYTYREGGRDFWVFLPSFNMAVVPWDGVNIRLALSETMGNMSFSNMQAGGSMSVTSQSDQTVTGFSASSGTPDLKPQLSRNLDLSLEWYGQNGDAAHLSGFWKSIKNYITYGETTQDMTFDLGDLGEQTEKASVTNYINSDKETVIRGFEFGFTKFANFLPAPFNGIGLDANFTYIDSYAPGDASYNMYGERINGLPVEMISRYNYNLTAMYERDPLSIRIAWNWRSKYLLTPTANGTSGNYDADTTGVTCSANDYSVGGTGLNPEDGACYYNLPIFSDSFGQFDASITYKFSPHLQMTLGGQNLLNAVTKTLMGYGAHQNYRSWFVSDRRVNFSLAYSY